MALFVAGGRRGRAHRDSSARTHLSTSSRMAGWSYSLSRYGSESTNTCHHHTEPFNWRLSYCCCARSAARQERTHGGPAAAPGSYSGPVVPDSWARGLDWSPPGWSGSPTRSQKRRRLLPGPLSSRLKLFFVFLKPICRWRSRRVRYDGKPRRIRALLVPIRRFARLWALAPCSGQRKGPLYPLFLFFSHPLPMIKRAREQVRRLV